MSDPEDAWWAHEDANEKWSEDYAIERINQRISDCVSQSAGRDHGSAEGLGESLLQEQVQRSCELLGCVPQRVIEVRVVSDAVPYDIGHWDSSHISSDDLNAFLGAVDAF
jgi:hypothetical protein